MLPSQDEEKESDVQYFDSLEEVLFLSSSPESRKLEGRARRSDMRVKEV